MLSGLVLTTCIFYNHPKESRLSIKKGHINFDLEELFKYINGGISAIGMKTNSSAVKTIDGYVKEFNSNDTWRKGAMTLEMLMQDNYDQGVADAEARAEAKAQKEIVKAQEELAKAK